MDRKQMLKIRKAQQEVADIFATTLLEMILDGKIESRSEHEVGHGRSEPHQGSGEALMELQPCR